MPTTPYYGKYRGKVENNIDPMQRGRVQVSCPAVLGSGSLSWALPCAPYAGKDVGFFFVPPVGANVWVEFEGGDANSPIYSGGFWGTGEAPAKPALAQTKVLKTDGVTITANDLPGGGGLKIEVGPPVVGLPMTLVFDASGIEIKHGTASLKLSAVSVNVNNGALEVI